MTDAPLPIDRLLAHRPWVRGLARALVSDDAAADDLEQETWLAALEGPPRDESSPRGWLAGVLRRRSAFAFRSRSRRARHEQAAVRTDGAPGAADVVAEAEVHGLVVQSVLALAEPERTTVLLRFFEGKPPRVIAAQMGVPVETVRSRLRRALERLRARLDDGQGGDAWRAALLPLTAGGPAHPGGVVGGGIAVTTKTKVLLVAAALMLALAAGLLVFLMRSMPTSPPPTSDDEVVRDAAVSSPTSEPQSVPDAAPTVREPAAPRSRAEPIPEAPAPRPSAAPVARAPVARVDPPAPPAVEQHAGKSKVDASLPRYERVPEELTGTLSAVGSDTMINLMTKWGEAFSAIYPGVKVQVEGKGSTTAPPALTAGVSQLGPMSREMKDAEIAAFQSKYGYGPTRFKVCIDALAVLVHRDNPLANVTVQQLDSIFSSTRKKGGDEITTWDQLGLGGEWAGKPITLYGRNSTSTTFGYFKEKVLDKGDFKDGVKEQPGSAGVVDGVVQDRYAIGYAGIGYTTPGVKALGLSYKDGGTVYQPTLGNVMTEQYPLGRFLNIYVNRSGDRPLSAEVREFLRFVYSAQGQEIVAKEGFLPLNEKLAAPERARGQ